MSFTVSRALARTAFLSTLALAVVSTGCNEKDKAIQPLFADGVLFVAVQDSQGKDIGGIGRVTYVSRTKAKPRSDQASFIGTQPVPAHVLIGAEDFDLATLGVVSADGTALATISKEELSHWLTVAKKGVMLSLTVERRAGLTTLKSYKFSMRATPPVIAAPVTTYRPLTAVIADPQSLLNEEDVSSATSLLRFAASATADYQKDLATILSKAGALDSAHLEMLIAASYYTLGSLQELYNYQNDSRYRDAVAALSKEDAGILRQRASVNFDLGSRLSPFVNSLVDDGAAKLSDLNFDGAVALLSALIPQQNTEVGTKAFQSVTDKIRLSAPQKLELMRLAFAKHGPTAGRALFLDWFKNDTQSSIHSFGEQLSSIPEGYRGALILDVVASSSRLSGGELALLVSWMGRNGAQNVVIEGAPLVRTLNTSELVSMMSYSSPASATLQLFLAKVSDLTGVNAALIAAQLSGDERTNFVFLYLSPLKTITTDNFAALVSMLEGDLRDRTILEYLPRISDRDSVHIAKLFGLLSPNARSVYILKFIDQLPSLTTEALIALSQAAPERSSFILLAYLDRLSDFTSSNAVLITKYLYQRDKDSVLLLAMERTKVITAEALLEVATAAYEKGAYFILNNLSKISPLNATGITQLARILGYNDKNTFVLAAIELLPTLTAQDVLTLSAATSGRNSYVLLHYLDRVTDLTLENVLALDRYLGGTDRDTLILYWFSKNLKVTTEHLIVLSGSVYYQATNILVDQLEKVTDLTVANALTIAARIGGGDLDRFILKAVELVTDLNSQNLITLANRAYGHRDDVLVKGINRLAKKP